jgi:smad nuclear-interacting protein 1
LKLSPKKEIHVSLKFIFIAILTRLEEIKNGVIKRKIKIHEKPFYLCGKLPKLSDILMLHPTISRKHGIIQHSKKDEVFMYDLGSTNGIMLNWKKIEKRKFVKVNVGDGLKFGLSKRMYVLSIQGENILDEIEDRVS